MHVDYWIHGDNINEAGKGSAKKSGACLAIIAGQLTKNLQFLDLFPNYSFKSHMWQQWETCMSSRLNAYIKGGILKKTSRLIRKQRNGY